METKKTWIEQITAAFDRDNEPEAMELEKAAISEAATECLALLNSYGGNNVVFCIAALEIIAREAKNTLPTELVNYINHIVKHIDTYTVFMPSPDAGQD